MVKKMGRFGPFLACSAYPECKHTQSLSPRETGKATGLKCPVEGCDGELIERRSKRGKIFYGCSRFPQCKFAVWDKPIDEKCPQCGAQYMLEKTTKKEGTYLVCPDRKCGYRKYPES
jgi:DNA topoisomerase-1